MRLRTRLLLAFAVVVAIPIGLLVLGIRQEMTDRLSTEYERRVATVVEVIDEDLRRESAGIGERLASLKSALLGDNRFRLAAVAGVESERSYLLDYAATAMRLTGLSMLQIHDADGRIISSGHFRNEHGRLEAGLTAALADAHTVATLLTARAPDGEFLVLARNESLEIAGRMFTLVGGVTVDGAFLARLARDREIVVSLSHPGGGFSSNPALSHDPTGAALAPTRAIIREIRIPLIRSPELAPLDIVDARLQVSQPLTPLEALLASMDSWFLATAAATGAVAFLLAVWVSSRISRPLAALADKTAVLDLDRLDVDFDSGTDEVGTLSRLLGDLTARLRTSTVRVREAERRATVGDLARQVNHDIKNGLIPLRNVFRHLTEVGRDDPDALRSVFAERRQTVDSSIEYLETLATNYERLSPLTDRRECDVNALMTDVARGAQERLDVELRIRAAANLPPVMGDPVALRRILENLIANAIDSLEGRPGRVTLSTALTEPAGEQPLVRLTIADTGRGMSRDESAKIFNDFYTTKSGGAGLGLSIVRRLVIDLHGTLRVESQPGGGTTTIIDIPASGPRRDS
jgi:signal transduction histidine kinase